MADIGSQKNVRADATKMPFLGSGVICDQLSRQKGKPAAHGIFTHMYAWAYPCNRSWFLIFSVFGATEFPIEGDISVRKKGGRQKSVKKEKFTVTEDEVLWTSQNLSAVTVNVKLGCEFGSPGLYEILISLDRSSSKLRIPLVLQTMPWPDFTEKEIGLAKKKGIPLSIRVNVACPKCKAAYIFEETIMEDEAHPTGVLSFPSSGLFECIDCGHELNLKDIQGQVRQTLKERLSSNSEVSHEI